MKDNASHLELLAEALERTMLQVTGLVLYRDPLRSPPAMGPINGISLVFGIHGLLVGQVVCCLDHSLAERLVKKKRAGISPLARRFLFADALGEVAISIARNATALLRENKGIDLRVATPLIAVGDNLRMRLIPRPSPILRLRSPNGSLDVGVSVERRGFALGMV